MPEAVIVAAARSPIGRAFKGSLKDLRPDDLSEQVVRGLLEKLPALDPQTIDDLYWGCADPSGAHGSNLARVVAVLAGMDHLPAATVNRFCASGLTAIAMAADRIRVGEAEAMIAGGTESMSTVPMMGHRPSMPDGLPCIGPAAATPDVLLAFGHGHVGLVAGPRTARAVIDLLAGRRPALPMERFSPLRFA